MILFIAVIIICCSAMLLWHFASRGKELIGTATVVSRRMEVSHMGGKWTDNYNRLITFRFSDGSELELYVTKEAYSVLQDGETGQLIWQGDQLLSFDSDI